MADIIRIIIKGGFGYGPVDEAYSDKVNIDRDSIRYEYQPVAESDINVPRKWSYKTTSPIFRKLYTEAKGIESCWYYHIPGYHRQCGSSGYRLSFGYSSGE